MPTKRSRTKEEPASETKKAKHGQTKPKTGRGKPRPATPLKTESVLASIKSEDINELDSTGKFKYRPIDSKKSQLRLLELLPSKKTGGPEQGVECRLALTSLDDSPSYNALSYVWGERKDVLAITVDGCPFSVTTNLYGALSRLQSSSTTKVIWVDAICINQNDLVERSEQVVLMGEIFRRAKGVDVWLGEADQESKLAFSLLRDLKRSVQDRSRCKRTLKNPKCLEHLYGLYRLFYRDYWWRVWVIQEIHLAQVIMIFCGRDTFSWTDLVLIQETLATYHTHDIDEIAHDREELSFLRVSIETRGPRHMLLSRTHQSPGKPNLTQTLLSHRFKDSSDPKDMVYSLVGLSTAHKDPRLAVDYSRSVCQVYTDVIEYVLNTTKRLDIICAMPRGDNPYDLPSWVPNWSFAGHGSSFLEDDSKHNFSAAGSRDAEARVSENKLVLYAKGIELGGIEIIGPQTMMEDMEDEVKAASAFASWQKMLEFEGKDVLALAEAFCRNVLVQKYRAEEVATWTAKPDFQKWIIGAFVRAVKAIQPGTELHAELAAFSDYHVGWRSSEEDDVLGRILFKGAAEMMFSRHVLITDTNLICLGPDIYKEGGVVVVLLGCQLPVILKPIAGHFTYMGEAFVNGYMYGKAVDELVDGKRELQEFEIH